jgi:GT2 family glycosyltransferase
VDSEFILFLNNATQVITSEWLSAMLEHAQRKEVGAVGAKLLYPNNTIQHAGVILGLRLGPYKVAGYSHKGMLNTLSGYYCRPHLIQNLSAVTVACMLTKKSLFEKVGGFDELNLPVAFNDIDYCLKLREKNYLIVYTPDAVLYHYESISKGYEDTPKKQARFLREVKYMREKWGDILDNDPYYNPNLTKEKEDFSLNI